MSQKLLDKVALITGASRGIGRACALCLAEEGADVVINYRTHADEAEAVARQVREMGRQALTVQADVGEREQVKRLVDAAVERFGRLDLVIANAYHTRQLPVLELEWDDVQRTLDVTMMGVWHVCQFGARQMVKQGGRGKILIIGSVHAHIPVRNSAPYNMAKAGINHFARTLAAELAPHRINVNVINPGWIDTPGERALASDEEIEAGARRLPWGRLGRPEEIGRAAVFLLSDDADYITGAALLVDGGLSVGLTTPS
jgi:glucose 1-dehydrogenase